MAEKKKSCKSKAEETVEKEKQEINEETAAEENAPEQNDEAEVLKNQLLSVMAEYDNFKKRTVKEKEKIYTDTVGDTVALLLPVLDNLERAISTFADTENEFYKGFELVLKQTTDIFEKIGVKPIVSVGEAFNPDFHNAVMHVEDDSVGENIVVEEFQKGYMYKEKVIRYAMVKVAN